MLSLDLISLKIARKFGPSETEPRKEVGVQIGVSWPLTKGAARERALQAEEKREKPRA